MKKQIPERRPSRKELEKAFDVIDAYQLHFYQLLYFNVPRLTEPGDGHPFNLRPSQEHTHCIQVEAWDRFLGRREEFDFLITPEMEDEEVLSNCQAVSIAIASNKKKINSMACCPLAKMSPCVCAYAFRCKLHGDQHIGTHD